MMSYEELEEALLVGKVVERCTINEVCKDVAWHPVTKINRVFDVSRYRILEK